MTIVLSWSKQTTESSAGSLAETDKFIPKLLRKRKGPRITKTFLRLRNREYSHVPVMKPAPILCYTEMCATEHHLSPVETRYINHTPEQAPGSKAVGQPKRDYWMVILWNFWFFLSYWIFWFVCLDFISLCFAEFLFLCFERAKEHEVGWVGRWRGSGGVGGEKNIIKICCMKILIKN